MQLRHNSAQYVNIKILIIHITVESAISRENNDYYIIQELKYSQSDDYVRS